LEIGTIQTSFFYESGQELIMGAERWGVLKRFLSHAIADPLILLKWILAVRAARAECLEHW
jgi:hypothetical protein